jgi:hypothetical protein
MKLTITTHSMYTMRTTLKSARSGNLRNTWVTRIQVKFFVVEINTWGVAEKSTTRGQTVNVKGHNKRVLCTLSYDITFFIYEKIRVQSHTQSILYSLYNDIKMNKTLNWNGLSLWNMK